MALDMRDEELSSSSTRGIEVFKQKLEQQNQWFFRKIKWSTQLLVYHMRLANLLKLSEVVLGESCVARGWRRDGRVEKGILGKLVKECMRSIYL
jgi:hypothetical protein